MSKSFEMLPFGRIVWEDRYGLKDPAGNLIEKDIFETFRRAARAMAIKEADPIYWESAFYEVMASRYFCPAGRILAHSGTHYSQLLNCFVLPFEDDSLESIMDTAKKMAITQKFGGGCGFLYSSLRPAGSHIKGVNGRSCGVMGFMNMMSTISEVIEQGGSRRGANLGLLEVSHPDIWEYISYKTEHNWDKLREIMDVKDEEAWSAFKFENLYKLQMYNISVGVTDEFFTALKNGADWPLMWRGNEWELYTVEFKKSSGLTTSFEVVADSDKTAKWKVKRKTPYPSAKDTFNIVSKRKIKAKELWEKICFNAWADGCPGLINLSTARKFHNLEYERPLISANPCAEQMLGAYSSCNLSSLILDSFVDKKLKTFDFIAFKKAIHSAVRFADNVIDNCEFPVAENKEIALGERRVGLGTMGVHDMLIAMELDYASEEGRNAVEKILIILRDEAYRASIEIAKEKGSFPFFDKDKYMQNAFIKTLPADIQGDIVKHGIRNSLLLSQAPTGTISTLFNVSSGCEPWFALSMQRNTRLGSYEDGCSAFIEWKKSHQDEKPPAYFTTAQDISPEDHIKMMVLFSKYIDSAVSKTINLPNSATVEDISKAFLYAMDNGAKGITIFRDGSKDGVLISKDKGAKKEPIPEVIHKEEKQVDTRVFPKKRGNRAVGATHRIRLQSHNLYVTANRNTDGDLVEIFATVGESKKSNPHHTSGVEDSWAEGLAKIVSLALRAGVSPQSVIRNLKNIPSDKPVFTTIGDNETSELIPSPPHAIARIIEEELKYSIQHHKDSNVKKSRHCDECGSTNTKSKSDTCYLCNDCGYSGCS